MRNHNWKFSLQIMKLEGMPEPPSSLGFREVVCRMRSGEQMTCHVCKGTGIAWKEKCGRCNGSGALTGVRALRATVYEPASRRLIDYVDKLYAWGKKNNIDMDDYISVNIPLFESGGYCPDEKYGTATIVCGVHGEKLRAFHFDSNPLGPHAFFWVGIALLVQVRHGSLTGGKFQGRVLLISDNQDRDYGLGVGKRKLYHFHFDESYEVDSIEKLCKSKVDFPSEVARVAIEKSFDPNCRRAYWVLDAY